MCRHALSNLSFDCCFSSPISRAKVRTLLGASKLLKVGHLVVDRSWFFGSFSLLSPRCIYQLGLFTILNARSLIQRSAELIWQEREEPLIFLDSLKEANLYFLEGMKNGLHTISLAKKNLLFSRSYKLMNDAFYIWRQSMLKGNTLSYTTHGGRTLLTLR